MITNNFSRMSFGNPFPKELREVANGQLVVEDKSGLLKKVSRHGDKHLVTGFEENGVIYPHSDAEVLPTKAVIDGFTPVNGKKPISQ